MGLVAMSPEGADIDFSPSSQQRTVHEASEESIQAGHKEMEAVVTGSGRGHQGLLLEVFSG